MYVTPRISQMPDTDAWYCTWVFSFWYTRTTSRIDITIKDRTNVTAKLGRRRRRQRKQVVVIVVTQVDNKVDIEAHRREHGMSGRHHQLYYRSQVTRRHRVGSALLKEKF